MIGVGDTLLRIRTFGCGIALLVLAQGSGTDFENERHRLEKIRAVFLGFVVRELSHVNFKDDFLEGSDEFRG